MLINYQQEISLCEYHFMSTLRERKNHHILKVTHDHYWRTLIIIINPQCIITNLQYIIINPQYIIIINPQYIINYKQ